MESLKINRFFITILLVCWFFILHAQNSELYTIEKSVSGNASKFGEKNKVEYRILENDQELYSITIEIDYDVPVPALRVFENGSSVLVNAFDASLTFYDENGSEFLKSSINKELNVKYERSIYSAVSGNELVIALSQPQEENILVQFYNNLGQLILNTQIQDKLINGLSYSFEGDMAALSLFNWDQNQLNQSTVFLKNNATIVSKIGQNFTSGLFYEKASLFVGYSNTNCFVYDFSNKSLIFEKTAANKESILTAQYAGNKIFIVYADEPRLEAGRWYYKNPAIEVYGLNGEINKSVNLTTNDFSEFDLVVDKSNVWFQTENNRYQVE